MHVEPRWTNNSGTADARDPRCSLTPTMGQLGDQTAFEGWSTHSVRRLHVHSTAVQLEDTLHILQACVLVTVSIRGFFGVRGDPTCPNMASHATDLSAESCLSSSLARFEGCT